MLIDRYVSDFEAVLRQESLALPLGARMLLLIDGVFVPGIYREIVGHQPILLFASLPGSSDDAKDVSPFVVPYDPANASIARLLRRCSGWPMVSAIATYESAVTLARRLAAWCVVEVDGQRFNFRFPDTRRLPAIFDTLTEQQRSEMIGNAIAWRYVGREGTWRNLLLEPCARAAPVSVKADLDNAQFGRLVSDSEPDEMWVRLQDRGISSRLAPSERYTLLSIALELAKRGGVDKLGTLRWCSACMSTGDTNALAMADQFSRWIMGSTRTTDEISPTIA